MEKSDKSLKKCLQQWIVNKLDSQTAIESIVRLQGATSSTLHKVYLHKQKVVIRQFDNEEWLREEPDLPFHEAESLRLAAKVQVNTPEIIAYDEKATICGIPVVLMTFVDGMVDLRPQNIDSWLAGLALALRQIHEVEVRDFAWEYFTYNDVDKLEVPVWSSVPNVWEEAIKIVQGDRPIYKPCFIHRDFHPTNVLWKNDSVSGVVDWVNACRGPAGIDVGHCRLNLSILFDVSVADKFLTAYEQINGDKFSYELYWDLLALIEVLQARPTVYPGWKAFGVSGLTEEMMVERLDKYVQSLINRA